MIRRSLLLSLLLISSTVGPAVAESPPHDPVVPASQPAAPLKLYGGPRTRAPMVQWYLEELGLSYDYVALDIRAGEQRQPDYLAINPMGKLPALVEGEFKLWESGAILLYLADNYARQDQAPTTVQARAIETQWVMFANATLGPSLFLEKRREREMPRQLGPLNDILQNQPYLLGTKLSAADIAVGSYLYFAQRRLSLDYSDYPAVLAYLEALTQRPAFQNTMGKR